MWGNMGSYGWGSMGFGGIGMLLFWGLVIAGIVVLVRGLTRSDAAETGLPKKSSLDILRERYARGEIQREEFEQKKRDLGA